MEKEEEALRNYCRRRISLVRSKQQLETPEEERRRKHKDEHTGREKSSGCEPQGGAGDERRDGRRERHQPSLGLSSCQGPEDQSVPAQLISMLRLKTFKEEMRRAAEVELHDPTVCRVCEQEQAPLALRSFIRRKKTQLQIQTLPGRLNTHLSFGSVCMSGEFVQNLPKPFNDAPHWIWEEHVRVTATWSCLSNS